MTPVPKTLLLTLYVELGQTSSLKCKQLWHFVTKFTTVFQNTPYCKFQGHSCLPPVIVLAPGGASSITASARKGRCRNRRSQHFRNRTQLCSLARGLRSRKSGLGFPHHTAE